MEQRERMRLFCSRLGRRPWWGWRWGQVVKESRVLRALRCVAFTRGLTHGWTTAVGGNVQFSGLSLGHKVWKRRQDAPTPAFPPWSSQSLPCLLLRAPTSCGPSGGHPGSISGIRPHDRMRTGRTLQADRVKRGQGMGNL